MKSKQLSEGDLLEFRLRRAAYDQARNNYLMIEESYQAWLKKIGKQYRMPAQFDLNQQTGVLLPREKANGRSDASA